MLYAFKLLLASFTAVSPEMTLFYVNSKQIPRSRMIKLKQKDINIAHQHTNQHTDKTGAAGKLNEPVRNQKLQLQF
ncbi:hypothetical protein T10_2810 [Trichinella papuae]|uniref:PiggyBac transposable element-derived protein domain-containing protein n=1 Tax=Trichinella papuae TaxID=268474 RepID=A0A0V1MVH4_9BILA|nr:hypothetical protein T10_2810 [Trichinella papuae]